MRNFYIPTPLLLSRSMSLLAGIPVYLKMEALQPVGSYKIRGMGYACSRAVEKGYKHLIAGSGGNAGYAVAYAGNQLDVKVTVVVPKTTSPLMHQLIEREGAQIEVYGDTLDEAMARAVERSHQENAAYIHPFDHPYLWEGHATIVDEIIDEGVKPGAIVVAVGGGGLLCGILQGLYAHGCKDVPMIAMETEGAASYFAAIQAGHVVTLDKIETVALSLGVKRVCEEAFQWSKRHPIYSIIASDLVAIKACLRFADEHRVLVEPACGIALAAVYENLIPLKNLSSIVIIVCGGANVSEELFCKWKSMISKAQE